MPADPVHLDGAVQCLPQVYVGQRSPFAPPIARPPPRQPLGYAFPQVLRVSIKIYLAGTGQGIQCLHRGGQLHSVVGRLSIGAGQNPLVRPVAQQCRPSTWSGVRVAGAISIYDHFRRTGHRSGYGSAFERCGLQSVPLLFPGILRSDLTRAILEFGSSPIEKLYRFG